jgi:hypothetical protein
MAVEAGWRFAQPDFEESDLQLFVSDRLKSELGMNRFSLDTKREDGIAQIALAVDQITLPGGLGLYVPELRVTSHAALEN